MTNRKAIRNPRKSTQGVQEIKSYHSGVEGSNEHTVKSQNKDYQRDPKCDKQSMLISHGFPHCKFVCSLKFICNPIISICTAFRFI